MSGRGSSCTRQLHEVIVFITLGQLKRSKRSHFSDNHNKAECIVHDTQCRYTGDLAPGIYIYMSLFSPISLALFPITVYIVPVLV